MYEATLNGSIEITGKVNPLTSETRLTWRNCWEKGGGEVAFRISWIIEKSFYTAARKDITFIFASYFTLPIFYGLFRNIAREVTHSPITSFINQLSQHEQKRCELGVDLTMAWGPVTLGYFVLTVLNPEAQLRSSSLSKYGVTKAPPTNFQSKFFTSKQRKKLHINIRP